MTSKSYPLIVACCMGIAGMVPSASAVTNLITGTITTSTNWSGTNLLQGTVTIPSGVVIGIDPGTRMLMNTNATLLVSGQLLADGTANQPILFTRAFANQRWSRIRFNAAASSRFRYCTFEFANCTGTHLDYYDDDCNTNSAPPARNYHEAIVAIATHLDFEGCTFRNLPDTAASAEGDAIAIISDDPGLPGTASAHIWKCQFLAIGQGIHSRHSYLLVENCYFTGHRGDNDDIDMYGESTPPPMIRSNLFLNPASDDMINPTRCSAIIMNNFITGSTDHGVVLRDRCAPVLINNVISNCSAAAISVQNQCNALLINNTLVNSGRGVRLFDHTNRWTTPYCLNPGSGTATLINCIIWNCPTSFELQDSPYPQDRGSHVTVFHSNVQGGTSTATVSANSTLTWGPGNLNANPLFTNGMRLQAGSPCIDAGTNAFELTGNPLATVTNDHDFLPRPLDGNGNGVAQFDMGAFEFLLPTADSNQDGIPDGWCQRFGFNPLDPDVPAANPDLDPKSNFEEWVADTNPTNALSYFRIAALSNLPPVRVYFSSSSNRLYTLRYADQSDLPLTNPVPGQINVPGTGGLNSLTDTTTTTQRVYRVEVEVP